MTDRDVGNYIRRRLGILPPDAPAGDQQQFTPAEVQRQRGSADGGAGKGSDGTPPVPINVSDYIRQLAGIPPRGNLL